jgi:hypothetical protein
MRELNLASASGKNFVAFPDMSGSMVMLNIPKILMAQELDDN